MHPHKSNLHIPPLWQSGRQVNQRDAPMLPYKLLPMTPQAFEQCMGPLCASYAEAIYTTMRNLSSSYGGGLYELRSYANGSIMMVLDDDQEAEASWGSSCVNLPLSSISIAANLIVSEALCNALYDHGDEDGALLMRTLHYAQKDALRDIISTTFSVTEPEYQREPEPSEIALANPPVDFPDSALIFKLLD